MEQHTTGAAFGGDEEIARLRQVLVWMIAIVCGIIPLDLLLGVILRSPVFYSCGAVLALLLPPAVLALALLRRRRLTQAALMLAAGVQIPSLLLAAVMPSLMPALLIVPAIVIALLLPYLEPRHIRTLSVVAVVLAVATLLLGTLLPPPELSLPPAVLAAYSAFGIVMSFSVLLLLLWQYSTRLLGVIAQTSSANAELEGARASLEATVASRTAALSSALAEVEARAAAQAHLIEENDQQRAALREMSVPVLPVGAGAIVIPLVGALDADRLQMLQHQALHAIEESRARHVLLDITGVPIIDTHVAQGLLAVVQSARLLGATVVLVGVRPEVAQTIVTLGIDMAGLVTRQSLQEGIAYTARQR